MICLFFYHINAQILDETRQGRIPRVRGVNLHVLKADGLRIRHAEHHFVVDDELQHDLPFLHLLGYSDLGPLGNRWRRQIHMKVGYFLDSAANLKPIARLEEDCGGPVTNVFHVSSDCHMEDVGPVRVVQVGRLEQELHHPLAWQGRQGGQQVALGQSQFLLDLVDGIPQPA